MGSSVMRWLAGAGMLVGAVGCEGAGAGTPDASKAASESIEVSLVVPRVADLPRCNAGRAGTVAYVSTSLELYVCSANSWKDIACTTSKAGTVAYATEPDTLYACVRGGWSPIATPKGETGPAGAEGAQGAAGANGKDTLVQATRIAAGLDCEWGGVRIYSGLDSDSDGELSGGEVTHTSFVCDGKPGTDVGGVCAPATLACDGQQPRLCDATGQWKPIGAACTGNTCIDGGCVGECTPGQSRCEYYGYYGSRQVCGADSKWVTEACNGTCQETYDYEDQQYHAFCYECSPGEASCDGQTPRTCSPEGKWVVGQACESQTCYAGYCSGECVAGETRCTGTDFQTCNYQGFWETQSCAGAVQDQCQEGVCVPELGCTAQPKAESSACDDGNVCTEADACNASGQCAGSNAADGTACNDGNACSAGDSCLAGACTDAQSTISACANGDGCCPAGCTLDDDNDCLYWAAGVQQDVAPQALVGWSQCYAGDYASSDDLTTVLGNCSGSKLLLACRKLGEPNYQLLAMAPREDVLFECGQDTYCAHQANGVGWYFTNSWSWGFAPGGETVYRNSCDYGGGGDQVHPELRMCWHTGGNQFNLGYRCGDDTIASNDAGYERVIYQAN